MRVRALAETDVEAVAALAAEFAEYLRGLGDAGAHNLTAAALRRDGFGPRAAFGGLVAAPVGAPEGAGEAASGLAGYLLYHLGYDADRAERNLHVIDLYVRRAARRQGAGRALLAAAADACRAAGGTHLVWAVYIPNTLAADFYTALGARYQTDLDFMIIEAERLSSNPEP